MYAINHNRERKRVACIIPPFFRLIESKNNRMIPAMHYIAEILDRRGHEVLYINGDFADDSTHYADRLSITLNNWLFEECYQQGHKSFDELIAILRDYRPDIVFISAGDVLIPTVEVGSAKSCAVMAKKIKQELNPLIKCIGYGHLLKYSKKEELNYLDAIIHGEGEDAAIAIVEDDLTGVIPESWCKFLDQLPILTDSYLYHQVNPEDWDYIMSMRGCPNRCTFCFQPVLRGYNIATMSAKRFVREIRYRIDNYGTKGFYFADMVFTTSKDPRTNEVLDRLLAVKKEYPDFHWWCESRIDSFNNLDIVIKMKEAGCNHLKFGVEMANQNMLNVIKKGITLKEVINSFKIAKEAGIKTTAYVLLGCPGFKDDDYDNMWYFFKDLEADNYVININVPYRGTEMYEQMKTQLHQAGLYQMGEEGFTHTSLIMKDFWGISTETLNKFFSLCGKKDDSYFRNYVRKIVDKEYYMKTKTIKYLIPDENKIYSYI